MGRGKTCKSSLCFAVAEDGGGGIPPSLQRFWAEDQVTVCLNALSPREMQGKQAGLNLSDGG